MTKRIRNCDLPITLFQQMEGSVPHDCYESNGATWAPDYVGDHDLRAAAHFHDFAYETGGDEYDREAADYAFARNLRRCGLGHFLTGVYFRRVRLEGINFFRYDLPPTGWAKWRLWWWCFFSRYLRF